MKRMVIALIALLLMGTAEAETTKGWVMCQPDSWVYIREKPSKKAPLAARGFMGFEVELDGRKSGKWVHCIVPCEYGEGWIREDFLSYCEPEEIGSENYKIRKNNTWARYSAGGRTRRKLQKGAKVKVYMKTAEWSVTSQGFIRTELLEACTEGEV